MDLAPPQTDTTPDVRDRVAALLVGGAALLVAAGTLFSLVFGPVWASRAEVVTITGPTGLVRLGFLVTAAVLLAGGSAWLGRLVTVTLALRSAVAVAVTGLLLVRDAGAVPLQAWIDGGAEILLLAAAAVVLTVWQDHGRPRLDHPPDAGTRLALAGGVVAVIANAFPPVAAGPVSGGDLLDLLPREALAWTALVAGAAVTLAILAVGARLRPAVGRRLVLLVVGLSGAAVVVSNALTLVVVRADLRPTLWAGLAAAGYLAVLVGAWLTGRSDGQTSSATA